MSSSLSHVRLTPRTRLSVHATYGAPLQQQVKSSIKSRAPYFTPAPPHRFNPISLSGHDLPFVRNRFVRFTFKIHSHPSLPSLRDSASKGPIRGKRVTVVARHSSKPRQVEAWHASLVTHCGYAQDAGTRCVDMEWIDGGRGCSGGKLGCIEFDPWKWNLSKVVVIIENNSDRFLRFGGSSLLSLLSRNFIF